MFRSGEEGTVGAETNYTSGGLATVPQFTTRLHKRQCVYQCKFRGRAAACAMRKRQNLRGKMHPFRFLSELRTRANLNPQLRTFKVSVLNPKMVLHVKYFALSHRIWLAG